jgi:hypothetical protein
MMGYPPSGFNEIELEDCRVFYYVPAMFPVAKSAASTEFRPYIEFLAKFRSKAGESTEGGLFAPILDLP